MTVKIPRCRKFTGYRPCEPYKLCSTCNEVIPFGKKIIIVNLDHLGDVLMTTAQLPALKRAYPESYIVWITLKGALPLLHNNPLIDRVYEWNAENRMILKTMQFDLALNADKNQNSSAFIMGLDAAERRGFGMNADGVIIPLNPSADYVYRMGLDDKLKFQQNQRTGQEILAETFDLNYQRDEYILEFTVEESEFCETKKREYGIFPGDISIGFNTGCSAQFPFKKMTIKQHVALINRLLDSTDKIKVLLLGGPVETERNQEIRRQVEQPERVTETPTTEGIRRGLVYINMCDIVVSGDTSGMHMAVALKKYVVVWFGASAAAEIDLYDRGEKVYAQMYTEGTWNMANPDPRCVETLDLDQVFEAIIRYNLS